MRFPMNFPFVLGTFIFSYWYRLFSIRGCLQLWVNHLSLSLKFEKDLILLLVAIFSNIQFWFEALSLGLTFEEDVIIILSNIQFALVPSAYI